MEISYAGLKNNPEKNVPIITIVWKREKTFKI